MEFDSDEERKIFCGSGEDEDDVESEYSSEEEGMGFLSQRNISESSHAPGESVSTVDSRLQCDENSKSGYSYESENSDDETLAEGRAYHDTDPQEDEFKTTLIETQGEIEFECDNEGGVFDLDEKEGGFGFPDESRRLFLFSSSTDSSNKSETPLSPDQAPIFSPDLIDKASMLFSTAASDGGTERADKKSRRLSSSSSESRLSVGGSIDSDESLDVTGVETKGDGQALSSRTDRLSEAAAATEMDVASTVDSRETTPDSMSTSGTPAPDDSSYVFQDARAAIRPRRLPPSQPKKSSGVAAGGGGGKKHKRRCSECAACLNEVDCGKCRFCKDMRKFGGPGRLRQKCIKRQCLKLSRILYEQDPLLGGKAQKMQEDVAAELKKLGSLPKHGQVGNELGEKQSKMAGDADKEIDVRTSLSGRMPKNLSAPKKVAPKKAGRKRSALHGGSKRGRKLARHSTRPTADYRSSISDRDFFPYTSSGRRRRPLSDIFEGMVREDPPPLVQCQGPECVNSARPHSKYCCDECGVQLAMK